MISVYFSTIFFNIGDFISMILRSFSNGFKNARTHALDANGKKYTQDSFAEEFGVSVDTVKNWEQGRVTPNVKTLIELCDFFECDMDYLFGTLDCKKHDIQFIHNETGLSETAIKELELLSAKASVFEEEQYDLNTINVLIKQLSNKSTSIIHWITIYLCSKGLEKDLWYYTESGTISPKKFHSTEPVIHMEKKSDTFDNLILIGLQNRIKALKEALLKQKSQKQ